MRKSIRRLCSSVAAASAVVMGVSHAQNGPITQSEEVISNPGDLVANFDAANIGPVLSELGVAWEQRTDDQGRPFIAATANNEFYFNIIPTACLGPNNTGCVGLNVLGLFIGPSPNLQTVSAFNQKYFFTSAGVLSDGSGAYLSRYEIADYGIPRGNFVSSLGSFLYLANEFQAEIHSATRTVSLEGFADDMASDALNRRASEKMGAHIQSPNTASAKHRAGFEETPLLIRELVASDQAARNKIQNKVGN